jgi:hypothetical protein
MRRDPITGEVLNLGRFELLARFTDPDAYIPLLEKHPKAAHFNQSASSVTLRRAHRRSFDRPAEVPRRLTLAWLAG